MAEIDERSHGMQSGSSKSIINDTLNAWLHYLQMFSGLCRSGARLATLLNSLGAGVGSGGPGTVEWEELLRSLLTAVTSAKIRAHGVLQKMENMSHHTTMKDDVYINLICDNILSIVNLHYGFYTTSCERLQNGSSCPCWKQDSHSQDAVSISPFNSTPLPRTDEDKSTHHLSPNDYSRSPIDSLKNKINRYPGMFTPDNYLSKDTKSYSSIDKSHTSSSSSEGFLMGGLDTFKMNQPLVCSISPVGCEMLKTRCFNDVLWGIGEDCSSKGPFPSPGTLVSTKSPFVKTLRNTPFTPSGIGAPKYQLPQPRRWSEAAAQEICEKEDDGSSARRWSVPWDGGPPPPPPNSNSQPRQLHIDSLADLWKENLSPNIGSFLDCNSDPLTAAILLLSCKPSNPDSFHGVIDRGSGKRMDTVSEPVETPKGYSMWSGNDVLPILKLPESLEHADENTTSNYE